MDYSFLITRVNELRQAAFDMQADADGGHADAMSRKLARIIQLAYELSPAVSDMSRIASARLALAYTDLGNAAVAEKMVCDEEIRRLRAEIDKLNGKMMARPNADIPAEKPAPLPVPQPKKPTTAKATA